MRPELGGDGLGPAKYASRVDVAALVLKGEDRVAAVMPGTDEDIHNRQPIVRGVKPRLHEGHWLKHGGACIGVGRCFSPHPPSPPSQLWCCYYAWVLSRSEPARL